MTYVNLLLLCCLLSINHARLGAAQTITLSFDEAIEIIQKGFGSPTVTGRQAQEAIYVVGETAKRNPELVAPFKEVLVKEIARLDAWDVHTEGSGEYKLALIEALFPLADRELVPLFIRQCQHGSFVGYGLAKVGRPAIPPLIDELLLGRYYTCAAVSLAAIATEGLGLASQLSPDEKNLLRRDLKELAVPALERFLKQAREEESAGLGGKIGSEEWRRVGSIKRVAESLEQIRQALSE